MKSYAATFFSHYDAIIFFGSLKERGIKAKLMPAPRKISASCGTSVSFETDVLIDFSAYELDAVYEENLRGFEIIYRA